jgi:glycyl-tRNA synthetase
MGEREHSTYYFDVADVDRMRKLYDMYEKEANIAIDNGLVLPAHDYVLKTSHTFNILDTRGAVGVTERQALFDRTRKLARRVAQAYVDQRQQAEFPWLTEEKTIIKVETAAAQQEITAAKAPFLFEIGTEELPPGDMTSALSQLETAVPALLDDLRLAHGEVKVMGTPRRLVVSVADLQTSQDDWVVEVKGPPADRAFDADGNPTRAAEGFARGKGLDVSDLVVEEVDGGKYVVARTAEKGQTALSALSEALPELIARIRFTKSMRWNESGVAFSRPIRWLLALMDGSVVPFSYAGYESGRQTRSLRFDRPERFDVVSPADYFKKLESQGIILDPQERKDVIKAQAEALAAEVGGHIPDDPALLDQVSFLVEQPTAFRGKFDAAYLDVLPPEALISVMKKHQRYFVIVDKDGNLMPYFIGVRNGGSEHLDVVTDGNEQVILARFADARFFVEKDLKKPLAEFVPDLGTLTFQKKLGSLLDKTQRITALVEALNSQMGLSANDAKTALRAAELCKADLATQMVVEMTSLQGIMGRYYALHSGESQAVGDAIFEHYLPRSASDSLPKSKPGLVVGLADRLDSLLGLFSAGLAPTGTKDPFALRRAALGICQNLIEWQTHFDLRWGLAEAAKVLPEPAGPELQQECQDFITGRLRGMLLDLGFNYDVVDAVLAAQGYDPYGALIAAQQLAAWAAREDWSDILPAYSRCVRITRDLDEIYPVNESLFEVESESELWAVVQKAETAKTNDLTVDAFLNAFVPVVPVINRFFNEVLVMAEDEAVRRNRLGLLQRVAALSEGIADLSGLEGF